jgi:hypothetical protein
MIREMLTDSAISGTLRKIDRVTRWRDGEIAQNRRSSEASVE